MVKTLRVGGAIWCPGRDTIGLAYLQIRERYLCWQSLGIRVMAIRFITGRAILLSHTRPLRSRTDCITITTCNISMTCRARLDDECLTGTFFSRSSNMWQVALTGLDENKSTKTSSQYNVFAPLVIFDRAMDV